MTDPAGWSLGKLNNLREVFGQSALMWPLPITTGLGDGVTFPTRNQVFPATRPVMFHYRTGCTGGREPVPEPGPVRRR